MKCPRPRHRGCESADSVRSGRAGRVDCLASSWSPARSRSSLFRRKSKSAERRTRRCGRRPPSCAIAQVTAYVARIGQRLAKAAPGAKYPYAFPVADYREINAFSLPGGPVWINRGVLHAATNESQVAGVLAHEIAHIAQRHAADQLTKTLLAKWSLGVLGAMLGNTGGAGTAQVAGAFVTNGVFLKFSRDDEREADRVGRADHDEGGMGSARDDRALRGASARTETRSGRVDVFFSTHPSPQDRIAQLTAAIGRRRGGVRDSAAVPRGEGACAQTATTAQDAHVVATLLGIGSW